jgi:hypothetical protein
MVILEQVARSRRRTGKAADEDEAQLATDCADALPTSGFWLEVDGRTKKGWQSSEQLSEKQPHSRRNILTCALPPMTRLRGSVLHTIESA